jgi:hypothetical protein
MQELGNFHQEREEGKKYHGIQYREIFDKRNKAGAQMHELREVK